MVKKNQKSLEQLPDGLSQEVRYLIGKEAGSVIKKAKESTKPVPCIQMAA